MFVPYANGSNTNHRLIYVFSNVYTRGRYLEFDFQSPLNTLGTQWMKKTITELRVLKFGLGLAKKLPYNPRFNIQMQIKGSQNPFIPSDIFKCNLCIGYKGLVKFMSELFAKYVYL